MDVEEGLTAPAVLGCGRSASGQPVPALPPPILRIVGDAALRRLERPSVSGACSLVFLLDGRWALKMADGWFFCRLLADERRVLDALRPMPLLVPRAQAFALDPGDPGPPRAFLLTDLIPGVVASTYLRECRPAERGRALRRIGAALRHLHASRCPAGLRAPEPWLTRMLARAAANLSTGNVDGGDQEDLADLTANRPAAARHRLIHGDATLDNCLLDGDNVHFVDWGMATLGDPRWDLIVLSMIDPAVPAADCAGALLDGYGTGPPSPALASYFTRLYEYF